MDINRDHAIQLVKGLIQGEVTPFILDEIKQDIALEILRTDINDSEKREECYMLCKAIERLEMKLQEYVNTTEGDL